MARPIVPAGIELVLHAQQGGLDRLHVLHCAANSANPTDEELLLAANTLVSYMTGQVNKYGTSVQFNYVVATDISRLAGHEFTVAFPAGTVGTAPGSELPGNVSLVTSIRTTKGGRRGHGRIYNFGLVVSALASPELVTIAYHDAIVGMWAGVNAGFTAAGLPLCVFSRADLALYVWQEVTADFALDSQRRRLLGRGR